MLPTTPLQQMQTMQMNVAETTPAFQEHIDGSLEQHVGPGKSNSTLHFHLLVPSQKCHPLVTPIYTFMFQYDQEVLKLLFSIVNRVVFAPRAYSHLRASPLALALSIRQDARSVTAAWRFSVGTVGRRRSDPNTPCSNSIYIYIYTVYAFTSPHSTGFREDCIDLFFACDSRWYLG